MKKSVSGMLSMSLISMLFTNHALAERPMRGVYTVPVSEELTQFNSYPVKFKTDGYAANPTTIQFPLPELLIGQEKWVEFKRLEGSTHEYAGENGTGTCAKYGRDFVCEFKFTDLPIDLTQVETKLASGQFTDAEIVGKRAVSETFGGEPIGVLRYRMKGK